MRVAAKMTLAAEAVRSARRMFSRTLADPRPQKWVAIAPI